MSLKPSRKCQGNLNQILELILELAAGNLEARLEPSAEGNELDALAVGLNMLAEELGASVREREQALQSLGVSEKKFRTITDTAQDAIVMVDNEGKVTLWNPAAEKIFGYTAEEASGQDVHTWLTTPEYRDKYKRGWPKFRETGQGPVIGDTFEIQARTKHRGFIPLEISVSSAYLQGRWHAVGILRDITERKAMEKSVKEDRKVLRVVDRTLSSFIAGADRRTAFDTVLVELLKLTGSQYGFLQDCRVDDEGKPYMQALAISNIAWNEETRKYYDDNAPDGFKFYDYDGLNAAAVVTGEVVIANDPASHPRSKGLPEGHPPLNAFLGIPLKRGETVIGTIGLANRKGGYDDAIVKRLELFWSAIAEVIEAHQSDEARRKSELRMEHMANYDELTGLPNRTLFRERLKYAAARAKRYEERFSLLLLDLDHFKDVNDTLGHPVGDALLAAVGARLKSAIRESDVVARLGGDEFAILELNLENANDAARYAQRLMDLLAQPFVIDDHQIHTDASIGIAIYAPDDSDPTHLLSQADTALYRAKAEGRRGYRFHDEQVEAEVRQRVAINEELHEAIVNNQFVLHFQPQVDIRTGRLVAVEALLRWNHPERGLLGPGEFVPVAEDSGLLLKIDDWVLQEACRQMRAWQDQGLMRAAAMSLNLSPLQFKTADFEKKIAAAMEEAGLDPHCLELEITERSLAERPEVVADVMKRLDARGVRFSIDDFGTGYSSMQYLKRLPVRKIKIAQEFVRDMKTDASDASIVRAIIGLGQELGLEVIAEGVETEEQLALLEDRGCYLIQGYLFGRPQPAAELTAWLQEREHSPEQEAPPLT
jgi:diguanylate cyclase (GGDEF)-like protein/PAS domain S-box-containing protein